MLASVFQQRTNIEKSLTLSIKNKSKVKKMV